MTPSQQRALEALWPKFGIEHRLDLLDLNTVFGRSADKILEIGFGNGDTLVQAAVEHPELDFLGVEVHKPGIGHCLLEARNAGICNLRVIAHDALEVLENQIANNTLARINLLFPDPWPKKRHYKRRIVNAPFLDLVERKLCTGGALYIATDWEDYAQHIDGVLVARSDFSLVERRQHDGNRPLDRHTTKFECRGLKKGHRIVDWQYAVNRPTGK